MAEQTWRRWQDWAALAIGVLIALSPIVVATNAAALWTLLVFGVLIAAAAVWSLAMPGSVYSEYVHMAFGVLLFISPWVMTYSTMGGASWVSWVGGALAVAAGAAALPEAQASHRGLAAGH